MTIDKGHKEPQSQTLTIFLVKEKLEHDSDILLDEGGYETSNIKIGNITATIAVKRNASNIPKWANFFTGITDIKKFGKVSSSGAVLILPIKNKKFALTFGVSRHLLKSENLVENFGLRTCLNSIDESKLKSIDKTILDSMGFHSRDQAITEMSLDNFGINFEQDLLRAITGQPTDNTLGSKISGSQSLHISPKIKIEQLPEILENILEKYTSETYKKNFAWVDHIAEITAKSQCDGLNERLIELLKKKRLDRIWMAVPEVIEWTNVDGIRFGKRIRDLLFSDINIEDFLNTFEDLNDLSIEKLKSRPIYAVDGSGTTKYTWRAYFCLYAELSDSTETFLLNGGKWYAISKDFVKEINNFYKKIPSHSEKLPEYKDNSEGTYNKRIAEELKKEGRDVVIMDKVLIHHGGGNSSVEFCDLYVDDSKLLHVKRYYSSSVLSHFFNQATVSAELFCSDPEFRKKLNQMLPEKHKLKNESQRPDTTAFEIVYGIISKAKGELDIPFFSKITLKHALRRLTSWQYNTSIIKIEMNDKFVKTSKKMKKI